jgi:hypothetical protein
MADWQGYGGIALAGGGGDSIFRPFVLILSFVALAGLLLVAFANMFNEAGRVRGDDTLPDLENVFGDYMTTPFTPSVAVSSDGNGSYMTNASVVSKVPKGETGGFPFDNKDKRVYVVRDNEYYGKHTYHEGSIGTNIVIPQPWTLYKDFIGIKRTSSDWVGGKVHRYAIPLETFVKNFDPETNTSQFYFPLSGSNYTILLKLTDNNTNRIWWNNYTIYLGYNFLNNQHVNFWTAIKMMYTGTIPNCNYYINKMLQAIVVFSSVFIIYEMATRILPF